MTMIWNVVSPEGRRAVDDTATAVVVPEIVDRLVFLSNTKPNTRELQDRVAAGLRASGVSATMEFYEKETMAVGAGDALLDEIADAADLVVNGVGD